MIGLFSLLGYVALLVPMFLMHELGHIKACGLKAKGTIHVGIAELFCITECSSDLSWYGGGVLSSIFMFLCSMFPVNSFTFGFFTLGWINLIYGILEGKYRGIGKLRYLVYFLITVVVLLAW